MSLTYKAKFLIDDYAPSYTHPITLANSISSAHLTENGDQEATWERETRSGTDYTNASSVNSPYQQGQIGNNAGEYCIIMPADTANDNTRFQKNPISIGSVWCIQFWFRADNTTFPSGGGQINNQVLLSYGFNGLPNTLNANRGLHIVAYANGANVDSIRLMKGNGTPTPNNTDVLSAVGCIPTITDNSTWIFICITHELIVDPPLSSVKMWIAPNNNNSYPSPSSKGLPSGWSSFTSTPTASDESFKQIDLSHNTAVLGYSGLSGYNQCRGAYSVLRIFENGLPSITQINNLYKYNALNGSTYGDVHVVPQIGNPYTFHTPGFYRYFDDNNGFIVNVQTELCKYERWDTNDYITNIYIKTNTGDMLCKAGFRGERVHVLNSNLDHEIKECYIGKNAYMYCAECRYKTSNNEYRKRHSARFGHYIPELVRNQVVLKINTSDNNYELVITNVDEQNLQPAHIEMQIMHEEHIHKYSGILIHQKYSTLALESLRDDMLMKSDNCIHMDTDIDTVLTTHNMVAV